MPRRRRNDALKTPFQTKERSKKEKRRQSVARPPATWRMDGGMGGGMEEGLSVDGDD